MIKAILVIAVVGISSARIQILGALVAIACSAGGEMVLLAARHGHAAWHYSAGFGLLILVGESCFCAATWLLYEDEQPFQRRALIERFGRERGDWPFI